MKQLFFFTLRQFTSNGQRALLAAPALVALLLLGGFAAPAFAENDIDDPAYKPEAEPRLQIYTDERGNRVMRTNPAPRDYDNQQGNYFYIAPEIHPDYWPGGHPGLYPQYPGPHPGPGPYPRHGGHYLPGGNPGQLHPGPHPGGGWQRPPHHP